MRAKDLIEQGTPCMVNFYDKSIQTIQDAKSKGPVYCRRWDQCQKDAGPGKKYSCAIRMAELVAKEVAKGSTIEKEMKIFRKEAITINHKGWITPDLQIETDFNNVCNHVRLFTEIILDLQEGEERYISEKKVPVAKCPKCKEGKLYFEERVPDSFGPNAPFSLAGSGSIINVYKCDKCHKRYDSDDLDMIKINAMAKANC